MALKTLTFGTQTHHVWHTRISRLVCHGGTQDRSIRLSVDVLVAEHFRLPLVRRETFDRDGIHGGLPMVPSLDDDPLLVLQATQRARHCPPPHRRLAHDALDTRVTIPPGLVMTALRQHEEHRLVVGPQLRGPRDALDDRRSMRHRPPSRASLFWTRALPLDGRKEPVYVDEIPAELDTWALLPSRRGVRLSNVCRPGP